MAKAKSKPDMYDTLISKIYRSAEPNHPWTEPLELLRSPLRANVACIRIAQTNPSHRQHLIAAGPMVCPAALKEWEVLNNHELLPVELKVGEAQIVDWDATSHGQAYGALLERYDIAHMAVMCIDYIEGAQCTLTCSRGAGEGPITPSELELFKTVGKHFQKAINIRRELTRSRIVSQFHTEALDSLGIAAFLVSKAGAPTLLNKTANFAIENQIGLKLAANKICAIDGVDDTLFQNAVKCALVASDGEYARAMFINHAESNERLQVVVKSQIHRSLVSDTEEMSALIFLRVSEVVCHDDVRLLQQLFSFTATEANLAIGLAKGLCLKDVEAQLNIRHNTARAHLRSMFVKADVSRQAQLVSLLTSSLVPLGRNTHQTLQ